MSSGYLIQKERYAALVNIAERQYTKYDEYHDGEVVDITDEELEEEKAYSKELLDRLESEFGKEMKEIAKLKKVGKSLGKEFMHCLELLNEEKKKLKVNHLKKAIMW